MRTEFPLLEVDLPPFSFVDMDSIMPVCTASLDHFDIVTVTISDIVVRTE